MREKEKMRVCVCCIESSGANTDGSPSAKFSAMLRNPERFAITRIGLGRFHAGYSSHESSASPDSDFLKEGSSRRKSHEWERNHPREKDRSVGPSIRRKGKQPRDFYQNDSTPDDEGWKQL